MGSKSDERGISWQDAFEHWKQVERAWGIIIKLKDVTLRPNGKYISLVGNIYYKLAGDSSTKWHHFRYLEFPSRNYKTLPAGLVYHLSGLDMTLEKERKRLWGDAEQGELPF